MTHESLQKLERGRLTSCTRTACRTGAAEQSCRHRRRPHRNGLLLLYKRGIAADTNVHEGGSLCGGITAAAHASYGLAQAFAWRFFCMLPA
jgi:hypothetical protein